MLQESYFRGGLDGESGPIIGMCLTGRYDIRRNPVRLQKPTKADSIVNVRRPFVTQPHVATLPNGNIVLGNSAEEYLRILSNDAVEPTRFHTNIKPEIVTASDKNRYYDEFENDELELQELVRSKVPFPKYKPYYKRIVVDDEGYILVETYSISEHNEDAIFVVFDSRGSFIGSLEMASPSAIAYGKCYRIITNDEELPKIVRFDLKPRN